MMLTWGDLKREGLLKRVFDIMVGGEAVGVLGLTTLGGTTWCGLKAGAMVGSGVPRPRGDRLDMGMLGGVMECRSSMEGGCREEGVMFIRLLRT